jgi:putative sigma-54 modulation protein
LHYSDAAPSSGALRVGGNIILGVCMNLTISGHHLEVTPAIRSYVQSKLERINRHFDQVIDMAVILTVDNLTEKEKRQKAEVTLRVSGKALYAESVSGDLYAAIDTLTDKLDRQVLKHKTKVQDHNHEAIKYIPDQTQAAA